MTNYNPITTLPVLAKFFDKLAHKRMMCFINRFSLLNINQLGFLAGQSTADALTEFLDNAFDAINENQVLLTVFLHFFKAFDTVDRAILLKKLYYYGFRGTTLDWFRSLLSNRSQLLKLNSNVLLLRM